MIRFGGWPRQEDDTAAQPEGNEAQPNGNEAENGDEAEPPGGEAPMRPAPSSSALLAAITRWLLAGASGDGARPALHLCGHSIERLDRVPWPSIGLVMWSVVDIDLWTADSDALELLVNLRRARVHNLEYTGPLR